MLCSKNIIDKLVIATQENTLQVDVKSAIVFGLSSLDVFYYLYFYSWY